jgi:glycosyltransferase involved in cell wall biosynthesis
MDARPFVSVVVATYDREKMLGECIDSLFRQTYPKDRLELIIVNDGSHDGTEGVLRAYEKMAPCRLKWLSQPNSGQTVSFNRGIWNSRGDIVCITGDDCVADERWIENLVGGYAADDIGGVGGIILGMGTGSLLERYLEKNRFFSQETGISIALIGGNSSFRKRVLEEVGGFDTFFRHGQDTEICLRIRARGYVFNIVRDAVIHHRHKETVGGILEQSQRYERTYVRLHRKFTKNFHPGRRIRWLSSKLLRKVAVTPVKLVKLFFVEDSLFYAFEHCFDFLVLSAMVYGLVAELFFGREYNGEKTGARLDFIEKAKMPAGWGL